MLLLAACSDLFGPDREPYEIAGGNGQAGVVGAELASPLVLRVHDRKGRPVEGVVVDWRVEFGEGTVSPVTSATGRDGRATTRWTLGAIAGQHRVSAVVEGRVVATFVAHARPGAAASVRFEADTLYLFVADTTTPRLSVFDRYGNAVRDRPVGLSSAHPGVVGVADDGRVVGRSVGVTRLTARVEGAETEVTAVVQGWAMISAGAWHTCGITTAGRTYCWGGIGGGEVGHPSVTLSRRPAQVATDLVFATISAGDRHTCALTADGEAYCWGQNRYGQLGDGTAGGSLMPVQVQGGHRFTAISAGADYTCGLTADGAALCWGRGDAGQLGHGVLASSPAPVRADVASRLVSIHARGEQSCGLAEDGVAYCWGAIYESGDLSSGAFADLVITPTPKPVASELRFSALTAERFHACGLGPAGALHCWGDNSFGQLGDGSFTGSTVPVPVKGAPLLTTVSAGSFHTCGLTPSGTAYCWGFNEWGQLGTEETPDECTSQKFRCSNQPVPVATDRQFSRISSGYTHTCAVTSEGVAYCWGHNYYGQLGAGTRRWYYREPVRVGGPG
ncbi:MAG TPA: hypothetical protein VKZ58_12820 [Longimicrobiales bacterium]|nr:hypothetical protein [Longimicrobiales bacterium]